jgi:precorrin-8X/cobalt-precorrin-8 methylmutase
MSGERRYRRAPRGAPGPGTSRELGRYVMLGFCDRPAGDARRANVAAADVHPAEAEAYRILRSRIDLSHLPSLARAVTERVILASADFDYAADLVCDERTLTAAVAALAAGAPVVADSPMVAAAMAGHDVICRAGDPLTARLARVTGIPPAAAAVRLAFSETGPGAVWVVGTAPTALEEIIGRGIEPALVVGMPAGLAGVAEAKQSLRSSGLPSLSNVSQKGGAAVAAAAVTALLDVTREYLAARRETAEGRDG